MQACARNMTALRSGQVTAVPLHEIHFEKGLGQARRTAGTGQLRSSGEASVGCFLQAVTGLKVLESPFE